MTRELFPVGRPLESPVVIAGPCMAESPELLQAVAAALIPLASELNFQFVFKASFDKANRTSIHSYRGPGLKQAMQWFEDLRRTWKDLAILTDVHETDQLNAVAEVCDVLQIPAFLCRQTDLVCAAARTGRAVNIKKGQFLAPGSAQHLVNKVKEACELDGRAANVALTERGTTFGYGDLVVDMRGLKTMAATGAPVIFDITHSTQQPAAGQAVSGGARSTAPLLARAAVATGYLGGLFLEVHPDPKVAKSDAATQLSIPQAEALLRQVIPLWYESEFAAKIDGEFI